MTTYLLFFLIIALFFALLLLKQLLPKKIKDKFCVLCATISASWVTLLVLYLSGVYGDPILIGMLIGQSIIGLFYLLEKRVKEELKVFALAFILTLTYLFYSILTKKFIVQVFLMLLVLWGFLLFVYMYRSNKNISKFVNKLVECCKRW